jgi:hypothetical protein
MESLQNLPHDDISWRIWVGGFSTIIPATVVVALRYVARYVSRAGLWWDDYTIAVSLVGALYYLGSKCQYGISRNTN